MIRDCGVGNGSKGDRTSIVFSERGRALVAVSTPSLRERNESTQGEKNIQVRII